MERLVELAGPLGLFPPVEFACAYGSSLLPNNKGDKALMVDYILGVQDPIQWHSENLEANKHHYSTWIARLGPSTITRVADRIGVGVHFNPFVEWKDKMIKYGVVQMDDLARDVLTWDQFYLSGRLQKPVHVLIDNWEIRKVNFVNLKAATSAALLLLPAEFSEEDLYAKICSLSYMGDLRMLFAEDKDKVKKIVHGSFTSFQAMYKPFLHEFMYEGLLKSSSHAHQQTFEQDFGIPATRSILSSLPLESRELGGLQRVSGLGGFTGRESATNFVRRVLRRRVMASSARQAVSGLLATGGVNVARYLAKKVAKAWKSRTSCVKI